jgi:hypothetical protein
VERGEEGIGEVERVRRILLRWKRAKKLLARLKKG